MLKFIYIYSFKPKIMHLHADLGMIEYFYRLKACQMITATVKIILFYYFFLEY